MSGKYKKFKNPKIRYIFEKALVVSIICITFGNKDERIFEEEESIEILKIFGLVNNIKMYQKINMTEKNIGQEFRLKEIDEKRNHFIKETNQNELKLKKHKKVSKILNYTKHLLILASKDTGCVSISAFASLVGTPSSW